MIKMHYIIEPFQGYTELLSDVPCVSADEHPWALALEEARDTINRAKRPKGLIPNTFCRMHIFPGGTHMIRTLRDVGVRFHRTTHTQRKNKVLGLLRSDKIPAATRLDVITALEGMDMMLMNARGWASPDEWERRRHTRLMRELRIALKHTNYPKAVSSPSLRKL